MPVHMLNRRMALTVCGAEEQLQVQVFTGFIAQVGWLGTG